MLTKLLEHDFETDYRNNLKLNHTPTLYHKRYIQTSIIILIFLSCSMARYNPILWREIYSGKETDLIFHFEKSFNDVNEMIRLVNHIIMDAEKGKLFWIYDPFRGLRPKAK